MPAAWITASSCTTPPGGTYKRLAQEKGERRSPRFFYDRGSLEILSPSTGHDAVSRVVAALVEILAEEADADLFNAGSTTFGREELAAGFEPDESFYFAANAARVRGIVRDRGSVELGAGDPPPDLVVEVGVPGLLDRLPIYRRLGVGEVWRHDGDRLAVLAPPDAPGFPGAYREAPGSAFLPGIPVALLARLVSEGLALDRREWRRRVRASLC